MVLQDTCSNTLKSCLHWCVIYKRDNMQSIYKTRLRGINFIGSCQLTKVDLLAFQTRQTNVHWNQWLRQLGELLLQWRGLLPIIIKKPWLEISRAWNPQVQKSTVLQRRQRWNVALSSAWKITGAWIWFTITNITWTPWTTLLYHQKIRTLMPSRNNQPILTSLSHSIYVKYLSFPSYPIVEPIVSANLVFESNRPLLSGSEWLVEWREPDSPRGWDIGEPLADLYSQVEVSLCTCAWSSRDPKCSGSGMRTAWYIKMACIWRSAVRALMMWFLSGQKR